MLGAIQKSAVVITTKHVFFTELLYSMKYVEVEGDDPIDTAATDGETLWVNKDWFNKIPSTPKKVGLVCHELSHKMLLHSTRRGTRHPKVWNWACDYAVNWMLKECGIDIPEGGLYDAKYANMTAEVIYAELVKKPEISEAMKANGGKGMMPSGMGAGGDMMDVVDRAGTQQEKDEFEAMIRVQVNKAAENARACGSLPGCLKQLIDQVNEPQPELWYNTLHRFMQAAFAAEYSWARTNRRYLITHGAFAPSFHGASMGHVAVYLDTSGSCFAAAQQADFAGHLTAILAECRPRLTTVKYFDVRVHEGEVFQNGEVDVRLEPRGGGGTDFRPLIGDIEGMDEPPDVVIVLTDLIGPVPDTAPAMPVVWALTSDETPPFGECLRIE